MSNTETQTTFDTAIAVGLRWQNSPLVHAINEVVAASEDHDGFHIANNKATRRVISAAEDLQILHERIMDGMLDGLGYPIEEH